MRIIHGQEFDDEQLREFKTCIYSNIVKGMRVLIDARNKLGIPLTDESLAKLEMFVFNFDGNQKLDEQQFSLYIQPMRKLWQDGGIRSAFDRRREFQLVSKSVIYRLKCFT